MEKLVVYHNDLNSIKLGQFRAVEVDIFFAILYKLKNNSENKVVLTFDELKKISNYKMTADSKFIYNLREINKKLLSLNFEKEIENGIFVGATFFNYYMINQGERTLTLSINEMLIYLINDLKNTFTQFELKRLVQMESKYSKIIFRFLKQFDNKNKTCYWDVSLNEFKNLLEIPISYKMSNIDNRVLAPALTELSPFFHNLKVTKKKKGRNIDRLRFEWNTETVEMKKRRKMNQKNQKLNQKENTKS